MTDGDAPGAVTESSAPEVPARSERKEVSSSGGKRRKAKRGFLRSVGAVLTNTIRILFFDSVGSWRRDFKYFGPALASICLVLIGGGVIGILTFSGFQLLQTQTRDASVLTVYLLDSADPNAISRLSSQLQADSRVASITYVSKDQALVQAQQHPELAQLADFSGSNPFPASLVVQVKLIQDVGAIDAIVRQSPGVDPKIPTSYDPTTYDRVQLVLRALVFGGAALLLVACVVAIGLASTSVRAVIASRREELSVMKLFGTPAWMIRGPFLVEGALTGSIGGLFAGLSVGGLSLVATEKGRAIYVQWLPGIAPETSFIVMAALVVAGFGLGSLASLVELRRVRSLT